MDITSLAAVAELHALPSPLAPQLEPPSCPSHNRHKSKPTTVVGMSRVLATGDTADLWKDPQQQAVSVGQVGMEWTLVVSPYWSNDLSQACAGGVWSYPLGYTVV